MPQGTTFVDTTSGDLKYQGISGTPAILAGADGSVSLIPITMPVTGMSGVESTNFSGFTAIGTTIFNPSILWPGNSKITRIIKFQAILEVTSGVTAEVRLWNVSTGAAVTSSTLTSATLTPTMVSGTLTVGASPNIPNSEQLYEIQLRISVPASPSISDRAICKLGQFSINWS